MLGYDSLDEMVRSIDGLIANTVHPDDLENVLKDIGKDFYEGLTYETTHRMQKKDSSCFWTIDKGKIIRTEEGRLVLIGVCTDMTKFVSQQKKLEEKNVASDYLFKNLPGGYHRCAMDDDYTFLYVSERFLDLLGWTKEELHSKFDNKFVNLIHPEDRNLTSGYVDGIVKSPLKIHIRN